MIGFGGGLIDGGREVGLQTIRSTKPRDASRAYAHEVAGGHDDVRLPTDRTHRPLRRPDPTQRLAHPPASQPNRVGAASCARPDRRRRGRGLARRHAAPPHGRCPAHPGRTTPYLAIKQDNNGDTFLISPAQIPDIDQRALVTEVTARKIGAWTPDENDHPDEHTF